MTPRRVLEMRMSRLGNQSKCLSLVSILGVYVHPCPQRTVKDIMHIIFKDKCEISWNYVLPCSCGK